MRNRADVRAQGQPEGATRSGRQTAARAIRLAAVAVAGLGFFAFSPSPIYSQVQSAFGRGSRDFYRSRRWETPERLIFPGNQFVFARVRYNSHGYRDGWNIDYPDSDLNFPVRLAELTTISVPHDENGDPRHVVIDLTDERLFQYPWVYLIEPGYLDFTEAEADGLREYLLRGGFMHVDDFWGEEEWANWEMQIAKVLDPAEFPMTDIPLSHELFHCVFEITEIPQVPSIHAWARGMMTERRDAEQAYVRGIFDKNGRLMVVITFNTDLGDGWEREGENVDYFREISVKKAYPLGINIVVYAMTH